MNAEIENLESAIRHIKNSLDVKDWAKAVAVAAMRHRIGELASGEAQETAGIKLIIGEDGKARLYDDTYDIVIHCESKKEQERAVRLIKSINGMQKLKARGENE